jgi:hypothetical protein
MGMTREEIDAELKALGYPVEQSAPIISANSPSMTKAQIDAELASLGAPVETGFLHRAGQLGRGIVKGLGSTADLISNVGRAQQNSELNRMKIFQQKPEEILTETPTEGLPEYQNTFPEAVGLGEQYSPDKGDTLGKVLETTGEFLSPIPIPGLGYANVGKKFVEKGIKGAAKALGKEAAMSGAAATAIKATPRISEEGTATGTLEDLAKGIFGAKSADKIVSKNLTKSLAKIPKNLGLSLTTAMAKPNERVFGLAKEHDIKLPFNVGMRSRPMNFMANNYLKSMFTSGVYDDSLKNANESVVNAVKRNIDELGPSTLRPSEASGEYRRFIESEEKAAEKAAGALYEKANELLKKGDSVKPSNTANFIGNLREMLTRDIQSPATKGVAKIVGQLADSWKIAPSGATYSQLETKPELLETYLKQFKGRLPQVPVSSLIGARKELGTITKHDSTIKGSEAVLNGLKSAIDKDIEKLSNKEFLSEWRNANSVFKNDVADRFRGDIARSLLAKEMPTEAYNLLNTPAHVKELEKIAGKNEKSKDIFNSLKKAKVREIFSTALQDEALRVSPFIY